MGASQGELIDASQGELIDKALIRYTATPEVQKIISSMGRTEDIEFSPDYQCIAIAGFKNDCIYLFSLNIVHNNNIRLVEIGSCIVVRSSCLREPHGVTFIDNEHVIVANRAGGIHILNIPTKIGPSAEINIDPSASIKSNYKCRIESPGSVYTLKEGKDCYHVLVCNNYINTVTAHSVGLLDKINVKNKGVLISKGLLVPDGVRVSPDRKWLAVSSHFTGTVLLYRLGQELNRRTEPYGVLEGVVCPHAIRFSKDGNMLFVADSASPYMHIYRKKQDDWCSQQKPNKSIRMLNEYLFLSGRNNSQEGGVKGIDINFRDNILAATSEYLRLSFYDLDDVMQMPSLQIGDEIKEKSLKRDLDKEKFYARDRKMPYRVEASLIQWRR